MADASAHDEQMENLMGTEIFMSGIKQRKLQCIYYTAYSVDNATCKKPQKCR